MKKWFSLLLCLTMLFAVMPFSFAEEMAMLAAEEAVAEYGPVAVVAPEDETSVGEISIEELEVSADSLSGHQEEILAADAAVRSELIALCLSTAADFSGEALPAEGLEAFDCLDASYIVTADSSYQISIPDNFIKSAQSTTDNFVYQHSASDMVVSVTLVNQTSPEYNYAYLSYNGYAPKNAEFNNVPVVFGSKVSGGKYHWMELFNTAGKTVMLQSIHSASYYATGATITTEFFTSVKSIGSAELIVVPPIYTLSADGRSIFINRPMISGGTGNYTIAYNIYDSNGNAVNYFYSSEAAVAAAPGYNGVFNVYVVVSDGSDSKTVMTGWFTLTGYAAATQYRALCIGQTYANSPSITTLSCCSNDARSIAAMLGTMTSTPYTVNTQINLTANQILSAIGSTFAGATENDVSLFYYSGHGVRFSNAAAYDGALLGTDDNYILFTELRVALDKIPGKKIVIMDSCYSGNAINKAAGEIEWVTEADLKAFANLFIRTFADSSANSGELLGGSYYVLTACRKDQTSYAGSVVSVFTQYLEQSCGYNPFSSIRTAFTCDSNGDGKISLQEAYTGAYNGVWNAGYSQVTQVYPSASSQIIFGR